MPAANKQASDERHRKMLEVLALFRVVFKSVRSHYSKVQKKTGVNGAQLWALAHVAQAPGCNVGELARALAIHQSTASNLLNSLVEIGVVERRREEKDQRIVSLFPTPKGTRALKHAPRPLIGVLQQALSTIPERNLADLHVQLSRLVKAMPAKDANARATLLSQI